MFGAWADSKLQPIRNSPCLPNKFAPTLDLHRWWNRSFVVLECLAFLHPVSNEFANQRPYQIVRTWFSVLPPLHDAEHFPRTTDGCHCTGLHCSIFVLKFSYTHTGEHVYLFSKKGIKHKNAKYFDKKLWLSLTSNWAGSCWLWSWVQWVCCVCGSSRVHRWVRYKIDARAEIVRFEELSVCFWLVWNCFWR